MSDIESIYTVRRMTLDDDAMEPWTWAEIGRPRGLPNFLAAVRFFAPTAEFVRAFPILDARGETVATGAIYVDHAGRYFFVRRIL